MEKEVLWEKKFDEVLEGIERGPRQVPSDGFPSFVMQGVLDEKGM